MKAKSQGERSRGMIYQKVSRVFLMCCVLFLTAGLIYGQADKKKEEFKRLQNFKKANVSYKKGLTSFAKGNLKKADSYFIKCIKTFPDHASAYYYRSKVLYKQGNLEEAEGNIVTAKQNYDAYVTMNKAVFNRTRAKYAENQADLRKERDGSFIAKNDYEGGRGGRTGPGVDSRKALNKAREDYQKYLASVDIVRADYHFQHGQIHFKNKKAQPAIVEFLQAIKLNPKHSLAYNNLAAILYMTKNYKAASDIISQAQAEQVTINPKLIEAVKQKLAAK